MDDSIRRHDALVAAAVEQAAPEALPSVIASLQSDDDNAAAQGEALLSTFGYAPQEQHTGARALFTAFMLFVMLLRGAKLVYGTRRMVKNVRGVSRTASTQLLSLVSNEPTAENIPIRQAVQELSELVGQPLQSARTLTEIVLQKNLDEEKYQQFCKKLKTQLDKTQEFLLLLHQAFLPTGGYGAKRRLSKHIHLPRWCKPLKHWFLPLLRRVVCTASFLCLRLLPFGRIINFSPRRSPI